MRSLCAAAVALSLALLCVAGVSRQTPIDAPGVALRSHLAQLRVDRAKVVQAASNGVNIAVRISRLGRDRRVLTTDEGIILVTLRNGAWKVQARSTMGS